MKRNSRNHNIDQQFDRIVEILHSVPEVPVPEGFDQRLQAALRNETIPLDRHVVSAAKGTGFFSSRRMRIGMSLAACFVVGILSISMYNSGMWDPPLQPGTELSGTAGAGIASEEGTTDAVSPDTGGEAEVGVLNDTPDGGAVQERSQKEEITLDEKEEPVTIKTAEPEAAPTPPQQVQIASDPVSRHGGQFAELRDEQILYSALAERYMNGQQYELYSYTWDLKTGEHRFSLLVWESGTDGITERFIVLVGARGEIYEEQQPDELIEPTRGD